MKAWPFIVSYFSAFFYYRMEEELGSLQPWQIFSALYLGFWSLSAYFDHFLMTFVFCLAFGVMSEIATRLTAMFILNKDDKIHNSEYLKSCRGVTNIYTCRLSVLNNKINLSVLTKLYMNKL